MAQKDNNDIFIYTASVFAIMSMLWHLTKLVSSLSSNLLYRDTLMVLHGAIVFLAGAGCAGISLVLMLWVWLAQT